MTRVMTNIIVRWQPTYFNYFTGDLTPLMSFVIAVFDLSSWLSFWEFTLGSGCLTSGTGGEGAWPPVSNFFTVFLVIFELKSFCMDSSIRSLTSKWVSTLVSVTTRPTWLKLRLSSNPIVFSSFRLLDSEDNGTTRIYFGESSWVSTFSPVLMLPDPSTGMSTRLNVVALKSRLFVGTFFTSWMPCPASFWFSSTFTAIRGSNSETIYFLLYPWFCTYIYTQDCKFLNQHLLGY